ncbi:hypothetical protein GPECTOR_19g218 [Gonium pectorale]|uniref:Uncharacterized protein n=1 Tax=Gonium pectorale TaxID=33097 RepID=A0A150GIX5_GONPE|nr:hypothetical protein GPECTOR_19g218 [Gonium pectorale]|eukprot:KXZ49767.1 hypothetical protein GPECTOR_19g218 [Gonium pectorale]
MSAWPPRRPTSASRARRLMTNLSCLHGGNTRNPSLESRITSLLEEVLPPPSAAAASLAAIPAPMAPQPPPPAQADLLREAAAQRLGRALERHRRAEAEAAEVQRSLAAGGELAAPFGGAVRRAVARGSAAGSPASVRVSPAGAEGSRAGADGMSPAVQSVPSGPAAGGAEARGSGGSGGLQPQPSGSSAASLGAGGGSAPANAGTGDGAAMPARPPAPGGGLAPLGAEGSDSCGGGGAGPAKPEVSGGITAPPPPPALAPSVRNSQPGLGSGVGSGVGGRAPVRRMMRAAGAQALHLQGLSYRAAKEACRALAGSAQPPGFSLRDATAVPEDPTDADCVRWSGGAGWARTAMPPQSYAWSSASLTAPGLPTSHLFPEQHAHEVQVVPWEPASPRLHLYLPASPRPSSRPLSSSRPPSHARPTSAAPGTASSVAAPQSPRRPAHAAGTGTGTGTVRIGAGASEPLHASPLLLVRSLHPPSSLAANALLSPRHAQPRYVQAAATAAVGAGLHGLVSPRGAARPPAHPTSASTSASPSPSPWTAAAAATGWPDGGAGAGGGGTPGAGSSSSSVPSSPRASFRAPAGRASASALPSAAAAAAAAAAASASASASAWVVAGPPPPPPPAATGVAGHGLQFGPAYPGVPGLGQGQGQSQGQGSRHGYGYGYGGVTQPAWGDWRSSSATGDRPGADSEYGEYGKYGGEGCIAGYSSGANAWEGEGPSSPSPRVEAAAGACSALRSASLERRAGPGSSGSGSPLEPLALFGPCGPTNQPPQPQEQHPAHPSRLAAPPQPGPVSLPEGQPLAPAPLSRAHGGSSGAWLTGLQAAGGGGVAELLPGGFLSPRAVGRSLSSSATTTPRPAWGATLGRGNSTIAAGGGAAAAGGVSPRVRPSSAMPMQPHGRQAGAAAGAGGAGGAAGGTVAAVLAAAPFEVVPDSAAQRRTSLLESLAAGHGGRGCGRVGRAVVGMLPVAHPAALAVPLEERVSQALADQSHKPPPAPPSAPPPSAPTRKVVRMLTERRESEAAAAAVDSAFSCPDPAAWMNQIMAECAAALAAAAAAAAAAHASGWRSPTAEPGSPAGASPAAAEAHPHPHPHPPRESLSHHPRDPETDSDGDEGGDEDGELDSIDQVLSHDSLALSAAATLVQPSSPQQQPPSPPAAPAVVARHTSAEAMHQHSLSYLASRGACRALAAASSPPPGAVSLRETVRLLGVAGRALAAGASLGGDRRRPASAGRLLTRGRD